MRVPSTKVKNFFGKYLNKVIEGDEIIVTKNGKGVAKLTAYKDIVSCTIGEGGEDYFVNKRITHEEFLTISDNSDTRYELINGTIYLLASPSHAHQIAIGELYVQLYNYLDNKPCMVASSPYDVKLYNDAECFEDDPNVVQPDILVLCDKENIINNRYEGIPTLVVEVLSPSTKKKDLFIKLNLYFNSGIKEYWIADLENKNMILYSLDTENITPVKTIKFGESFTSTYFKDLEIHTHKLLNLF